MTRTMSLNFVYLEPKDYSALRKCFQGIKSADDQQIVLDVGGARAKELDEKGAGGWQ